MNFLLEITKGDYTDKIIETKGFAETLGFGLQMLALGMLAVFAVLYARYFREGICQGQQKGEGTKGSRGSRPCSRSRLLQCRRGDRCRYRRRHCYGRK